MTFGILGVDANGQPNYANTDPEAEAYFGIDNGCEYSGEFDELRGGPPVRMWKVLEQLGPDGQQAAYSICSPDFDGGIEQIGTTLASYF